MTDSDFTARRFEQLDREGLAKVGAVLAAVVEEMGGVLDVDLATVLRNQGVAVNFVLVNDGTHVRVTITE